MAGPTFSDPRLLFWILVLFFARVALAVHEVDALLVARGRIFPLLIVCPPAVASLHGFRTGAWVGREASNTRWDLRRKNISETADLVKIVL